VMISGFLLLDPSKNESMSTFYKKRASRILAPLLFWSIFYSAWGEIRDILHQQPVSPSLLIEHLLVGKPHYHLWYLYMTLGLYIFTPYLRNLLRSVTDREAWIFCILLLLLSVLNTIAKHFYFGIDSLFTNMFLSYLGIFLAGHLIGKFTRILHKQTLILAFLLSVTVSCIGFYSFSRVGVLEASLYFYDILGIPILIAALTIFPILKNIDQPIINRTLLAKLVPLSLGIYLIHPAILETLNYLGLKPTDYISLFSIPIISVIVFVMSAVVVFLITKIPYIKKVV
jgi:surface polysaccharide O-acyltransferase-like enzyme